MVEIDDRAALAQMRVGERLGGVEHRAARDAASGERLHDLALIVLSRPAFDDFGEGRRIAGTCRRGIEAVVVAQIRPADDFEQRAKGSPVASVWVNLTRVRFNTASCIATSTSWPWPVRPRWTSAARIAIARCMPVPLSPILAPLSVGGPSAGPVTLIAPEVACATGSKHLKPL